MAKPKKPRKPRKITEFPQFEAPLVIPEDKPPEPGILEKFGPEDLMDLKGVLKFACALTIAGLRGEIDGDTNKQANANVKELISIHKLCGGVSVEISEQELKRTYKWMETASPDKLMQLLIAKDFSEMLAITVQNEVIDVTSEVKDEQQIAYEALRSRGLLPDESGANSKEVCKRVERVEQIDGQSDADVF